MVSSLISPLQLQKLHKGIFCALATSYVATIDVTVYDWQDMVYIASMDLGYKYKLIWCEKWWLTYP